MALIWQNNKNEIALIIWDMGIEWRLDFIEKGHQIEKRKLQYGATFFMGSHLLLEAFLLRISFILYASF